MKLRCSRSLFYLDSNNILFYCLIDSEETRELIMRNAEKGLAVVVELQGQLEGLARKVWKELEEEVCVKYIPSLSPAPHIALEYGFKAEYNRLEELLTNVSSRFSSFSINGMGLGVFVDDTPVVHIRWQMNKHFLGLKNTLSTGLLRANKQGFITEYESDENWQAKTTLAYKDSSYEKLNQILSIARPYNFRQKMIVNGISLYEYSNEKGEQKLDFFPFKT